VHNHLMSVKGELSGRVNVAGSRHALTAGTEHLVLHASQRFQQFAFAESLAQFSRDAHSRVESTARILMKVPDAACHDMPSVCV